MPGELGRTARGRIELNRLLPAAEADGVFRHELAHVFFESRCAGLSEASPLISEAFALFTTGDASRRAADDTKFLRASVARDWILAHPEARGHGREPQDALSRILAEPALEPEWKIFFSESFEECGSEDASTGRTDARFLALIRGKDNETRAKIDFFLQDGRSHEVLGEEGRPHVRFPSGSILKPSLVAAIPELMEPRAGRDTIDWRCPGRAVPGEIWSWQKALTRSCNGFFLDFETASPDPFRRWIDEMTALGFENLPAGMAGRIGLRSEFRISLLEAARLYEWTARRAPFVVDALDRTATDGTLAGAPDARWFEQRRISLKTGTVRDVRGLPRDAWIVAAGPRESGAPSFLAAIHANGIATSSLLGELRKRLAAVLTGLEIPADVQILGLVPSGSVEIHCEAETPLFVQSSDGTWRIEPSGSGRLPGKLEVANRYSCAAGPLLVRFPGRDGESRERRYFGTLRIDPPPPPGKSSLPLRAKSARARRGSRFVLETSESTYIVSSLLSEYPAGHTELLKALSLVLRHDLRSGRHGDRPTCDTTHCFLFGQDERATPAEKRRARDAVRETATLDFPEKSRAEWLPFFLDGSGDWTETRTTTEIRDALDLADEPTSLVRIGDSLQLEAGRRISFRCELLRNQLRLPSCPDSAAFERGRVEFRGRGEGHGLGLDLTAGQAAAGRGEDFRQILARAYGPGFADPR